MSFERQTIHRIREAIRNGRLREPFRPADVNTAIEIPYAGVFLPKHRVGNPGGFTELFIRVSRGLYRLK